MREFFIRFRDSAGPWDVTSISPVRVDDSYPENKHERLRFTAPVLPWAVATMRRIPSSYRPGVPILQSGKIDILDQQTEEVVETFGSFEEMCKFFGVDRD